MADSGPLTVARDGLRVAIRLSPRSKTDRLVGIAATIEGRCVLKAAVSAPPEAGRANDALLQLLSRAWRLQRRDLSIVHGFANRNKVVRIAGDPGQLFLRISVEISGLPRSLGEPG